MDQDIRMLSTLCYMQQDDQYLMLHRTVKQNDVNRDKWIGIGGHFQEGESPEECVKREVFEETGYTLLSFQYRGLVTFVSGKGVTEYMSLFTADKWSGDMHPCDEGELSWVDRQAVWQLPIWEGDKIFFRLLDEAGPFFSLKLVYDAQDRLTGAALNGQDMEFFDCVDEDGVPTGSLVERGVAHREGALHATAHTWVVRVRSAGHYDVLLQKRSAGKDSNPLCYDISTAGHLRSKETPMQAAVREMEEELGLTAKEADFHYVGRHRGAFDAEFYGQPFHDREISHVYVYAKPVQIEAMTLEETEVDSVIWMDMEDCARAVADGSLPNCIYPDELQMVRDFLQEQDGLFDR